jgi:AcrR family transcriptional regulator
VSGRGRPRRVETDAAIAAATRSLLADVGYAGLTVEEVARRAGVGKPTVYRRHASKAALVAAIVHDSLANANPTVPDSGDVRRDLTALLTNLVSTLTTTGFGAIVADLVSPASRDPELAAAVRAVLGHRRLVIASVLERAADEGRLASQSVDLAIDLVLGAVYFRYLITGTPIDAADVEGLVDTVITPG